ncbi:MAG TPA: GspH/FimT family pseudopilin [Opitutaceae bacterium]|nr:GspH/FimT family pseudopilin [Opitutaceae bacterium]
MPRCAQARPCRRPPGFTLVEVLLVLALMALVAAVLLPAAAALVRDPGTDNPDDLVAMVLQQARREAVVSGRTVTLRFEPRERRFAWSRAGDPVPAGGRAVPGITRADFLPPERGRAMLVRGRLVETDTRRGLDLFSDGTCTAARLRFEPEGGAPRLVAIDPWTCAPGLEVRP